MERDRNIERFLTRASEQRALAEAVSSASAKAAHVAMAERYWDKAVSLFAANFERRAEAARLSDLTRIETFPPSMRRYGQ